MRRDTSSAALASARLCGSVFTAGRALGDRPLGGGPEATFPAAFVFTFENGKIARAEDLRDRSAALASVGLPA